MLELIEYLKTKGHIRFRQQFCDAIGIHKQLYRQIKLGKQHFTAAHIEMVCKTYKVNANWIMGLEKNIISNKVISMKKEPLTKSLTR